MKKMASNLQDMLMFANIGNLCNARKPREILPRKNPFDDYDDDKFKERFRL